MPTARLTFYDYYWGKGEAAGAGFREDINRVVPADRKRTSADDERWVILDLGLLRENGPCGFLEGRRREQFLVALFFTALIDQGLHYYYPSFHPTYDRLTVPPKISTTLYNVDPAFVLQPSFGWKDWGSDRLATFREAESVFHEGFLEFAHKHLDGLDAREAWAKFARNFPIQVRDPLA